MELQTARALEKNLTYRAVRARWMFAARWKHTGLWAKVLQHKGCVGTEPRGTGDAFDKTMKTHYANIKAGKGAVFVAVFRGKVNLSTFNCELRCPVRRTHRPLTRR